MSGLRPVPGPLAVGVDAGGTRLRILAVGDGRTVARLTSAAPPLTDLAKFLLQIWKARGWTRRTVGALVVASRGIWTLAERRALARRLARLAGRVEVLSDAQAAYLGALGGRPGLLVLAGTGSIVIGRDGRGRWVRAGGFGPLLGDEGSAFWIGRAWLRATTGGEDFWSVRRLVTRRDAVARIASLAPAVLGRARRGDARARAIVSEAQEHLAGFAVGVARRLRLPRPVAVSWAGGVLADPHFRRGLIRVVARRGLRARWVPPSAAPVVAAVRVAERVLGRVARTGDGAECGGRPKRPRGRDRGRGGTASVL